MKTLFQHFKTATSYLVTVDSRILNFSNTFLGPLNITHFFREKKIDISNISAGRAKLLHPWTSSSRSLELTFQHFNIFNSSNVSFDFLVKNHITKFF